jgi:hypothetical protein
MEIIAPAFAASRHCVFSNNQFRGPETSALEVAAVELMVIVALTVLAPVTLTEV